MDKRSQLTQEISLILEHDVVLQQFASTTTLVGRNSEWLTKRIERLKAGDFCVGFVWATPEKGRRHNEKIARPGVAQIRTARRICPEKGGPLKKILSLICVMLLAFAMLTVVTLVTASGIDPPIFTYLAPRKIEDQRGGLRSGNVPGDAADDDVARQGGLTRRSRRGFRNWFLNRDSFGFGNSAMVHRNAAINRYGSGVLTRATGMAAA